MTRKTAAVFLVSSLIVGFTAFFLLPRSPTVTVDGKSVSVTIADDSAERQRGLSEKELLGPDEGMLFIFDQPGYYSFWMKEMNFPIDIIYIGEDKKIVHIFKAVSPDTFPQSFRPNEPAKYVLEVNAGWVEKNAISVGQKASF